jgi:hypothetical protein
MLNLLSGGGFTQGGSADRRYNASWIVERSVKMEKAYRTHVVSIISNLTVTY